MEQLNHRLNEGIFLTTEYEGKVNAMTIGWGMKGICWGKEIFIAMIRPSRYTYELLKESKTFTLSVPKAGMMKKEIKYFGSVSGRNEDKIKLSGVELIQAKEINCKIIDGCQEYFECRILFDQAMNENCFIEKDIIGKFYNDGVFHNIIFAEILAEY